MERMNTEVVIPLERYEELIGLETRVNVAVERINHDEYVKIEDLLWILGTEMSVEMAFELHEKSKKRMKEWQESKSIIEVSECENMG